MNRKSLVWIGMLCLGLTSCDLFEDLNKKSKDEETITLLTEGGTWSVDSMVYTIFPEADSIELHFGTLEFQNPANASNPGYGTGYVIHRYTLDGSSKVDTMAWIPSNIGIVDSEITDLTIYHNDPNGQPGLFSGIELYFKFKTKENKLVSMLGEGGGPASPGSPLSKVYKRYRLSR